MNRPLRTHEIDRELRDADIDTNDLIYAYEGDPYLLSVFGCHVTVGEFADPFEVFRCTRMELRRWLRAAFRAGRRSVER